MRTKHTFFPAVALALTAIFGLVGCGGSGNSTGPITVTVTPSNPSVAVGSMQTFTANVVGGTTPATVTWSVMGAGTIDSSTGVYTAPATVPTTNDVVTATSQGATGSAIVNVTASQALQISPGGPAIGAGASQAFTATAGGGSGSGSGSSGSATQTVVPGGAAVFSLTIAPTSGIMFPTAAVLTVTGLPTGASSSISPASWVQTSATSWTYPANTTLTNVELTIQLPSATASIDRKSQPGSSLPPVLWGLLLVPFTSRIRRKLSRLGNTISVLLLLAVACIVAAGVTGCGSSQGFFNQGPQTYNINETVTSGALSHSATFTLTVE